jgi:hypothetical protein
MGGVVCHCILHSFVSIAVLDLVMLHLQEGRHALGVLFEATRSKQRPCMGADAPAMYCTCCNMLQYMVLGFAKV